MNAMSMKEIQNVSFEILKRVTDICDQQDVRYWLTYGTLIGAIRHQGYIPWDDDVDIMMPRPDFEKFVQYIKLHKEEILPLELFTMDILDSYPYMLARVSDSRYRIEVENESSYGMGIFIDIYVLDGLGNTEVEARKTLKITNKIVSLLFLSTRNYYHVGTTKGIFRKIAKIPSFYFAKIMGKKFFVKKLMTHINKDNYDSSEYVGVSTWATRPIYYKKSLFDKLIEHKFESGMFKIPAEYDKVLRISYGDYMQLPPEKDRIYQHLFKAYKK